MSTADDTVKPVAHATPERHRGDLTLDDVYSPSNDDLLDVMRGMVQDCNQLFRKVQEHEQAAAKQAHKISELVMQNAELQAELGQARSYAEEQSAELDECRAMRKIAERDSSKRNTRNSMISIHELNEQLQIAATKYEREKSLRQKVQAESELLRLELVRCKREKQELLTKAAQQAQVALLQTEAIKHVRGQCDQAHVPINNEQSLHVHALGEAQPELENTKAATKVKLVQESADSTEVCAPHIEGSEAATPVLRLSVVPLQPLASGSPGPGTNQNQASAAMPSRNIVSPLASGTRPDRATCGTGDSELDGGIAAPPVEPCLQDPPGTCPSYEPNLMPLGEIIDSPSLTQQLSTEDEQHAPSSVMCSQVFNRMPGVTFDNISSHCTAVPEVSSSSSTATSSIPSRDVITSHPIEASTSNDVSERPLERETSGNRTAQPECLAGEESGWSKSADGALTRLASHDRHMASQWSKISELRQDASPDVDQSIDGSHNITLLPHASLERRVSSVSLAESDACPAVAPIVKSTSPPGNVPGEHSVSVSCASSCSHDENLYQAPVRVAMASCLPLSTLCQNKTPLKHKFGVSVNAPAKPPHSGLERQKGREPCVRLADTNWKSLQGPHSVAAKSEWRMGGSSIRVRPDGGRPKTALEVPSSMGPPATPRRVKVISPHKARTPDMSRLLGTPQRSRPGTPQRSRPLERRRPKLVLRSSLEDLPSHRPRSQGVADRRATIAPGTVLPSFKSDTKLGPCPIH